MDMTAERRAKAVACAERVAAVLAGHGVELRIVGSLARGDFGPHSDVDFLVIALPEDRRYRIESLVEDAMDGLPFSVLYRDEAPRLRGLALDAEAVAIDELGRAAIDQAADRPDSDPDDPTISVELEPGSRSSP